MKINKPIFCITSDVDWASEAAIEDFISITNSFNVKPTLFATHKSDVLKSASEKGLIDIGIHPNFLPNSSHGSEYDEVISHCVELYPESKAFRSHSFFENSIIMKNLHSLGFEYDSNLCLYLQQEINPLYHSSGITKLPVFFEDDVHWNFTKDWSFNSFIKEKCLTPGLKIFNFHPFLTALNVPSEEYYSSKKNHVKTLSTEDMNQLRFKEQGCRTFFIKLLEFLTEYKDCIYTLDEIYKEFPLDNFMQNTEEKGRVTNHSSTQMNDYKNMTEIEKQSFLQNTYNQRNGNDIYATSRDFNLRELEITSIQKFIKHGDRVLDLGCGNGYTLISLAKELKGSIIEGVDFSETLIKGANKILNDYKNELQSVPSFIHMDALKFLMTLEDNSIDTVITERFLQNMPSKNFQEKIMTEAYRVLKKEGKLLLCEAFDDSFHQLNVLRESVGLDKIEENTNANFTTIRLKEKEIQQFLEKELGFKYFKKSGYSNYFIISRVLHPLLVHPESPKFSAKINHYAKIIQEKLPFDTGIGTNSLWVYKKYKED